MESPDLKIFCALIRESIPNGGLYGLRELLADKQIVFLLNILHNRVIHLVPSTPNRSAIDDPGERHHCYLCRSSTEIHYHAAHGLSDRQIRTNSGGYRLINEEDLGGSC